jgi:hypothetical protein
VRLLVTVTEQPSFHGELRGPPAQLGLQAPPQAIGQPHAHAPRCRADLRRASSARRTSPARALLPHRDAAVGHGHAPVAEAAPRGQPVVRRVQGEVELRRERRGAAAGGLDEAVRRGERGGVGVVPGAVPRGHDEGEQKASVHPGLRCEQSSTGLACKLNQCR